jgi:hypothetical protein
MGAVAPLRTLDYLVRTRGVPQINHNATAETKGAAAGGGAGRDAAS